MSASPVELLLMNSSGEKVGTRSVRPELLSSSKDPSVLHEMVRWQLSLERAGTHKAKTRAEVRGGGVKPWKQKGTGRARAGSRRSPLWVGGGIVHGPKVRDYDFRLNKKVRKGALRQAIAERLNGQMVLIEDFGLSEIGTRKAAEVLKSAGRKPGQRALVVAGKSDPYAEKSFRNIKGVTVLSPDGVNVYDVLHADLIVISSKAFDELEKRLAGEK